MRMSSPAAALLITLLAATNAAAQKYEAKSVAVARYAGIRDTAVTPGSANREPSPHWFQKGECAPGTVAIGEPIGPVSMRLQPVMPVMPQMPSRCVTWQRGRY